MLIATEGIDDKLTDSVTEDIDETKADSVVFNEGVALLTVSVIVNEDDVKLAKMALFVVSLMLNEVLELVTSSVILLPLDSEGMDVEKIEAVSSNVEPVNESVLVVILVSVCNDAPPLIIVDNVDAIVLIVEVELSETEIVSVADENVVPVAGSCVIPVTKDDWIDAMDGFCVSVPVATVTVSMVDVARVVIDENKVSVIDVNEISVFDNNGVVVCEDEVDAMVSVTEIELLVAEVASVADDRDVVALVSCVVSVIDDGWTAAVDDVCVSLLAPVVTASVFEVASIFEGEVLVTDVNDVSVVNNKDEAVVCVKSIAEDA